MHQVKEYKIHQFVTAEWHMAYSMDEAQLPEETPHDFMTSQSGESFTRRNQSNVLVDRDAVEHDHMLRLK